MLVSCPVEYKDPSTGEIKSTTAVFYVNPAKKTYIRIKNVFKDDRRMLLAVSTSVESYEDVIRAAGLEPRTKAPAAKK